MARWRDGIGDRVGRRPVVALSELAGSASPPGFNAGVAVHGDTTTNIVTMPLGIGDRCAKSDNANDTQRIAWWGFWFNRPYAAGIGLRTVVAAASGTAHARFAWYAADGSYGGIDYAPGTLLVDLGTVDCSTTGTKIATNSTPIGPGLVWAASNHETGFSGSWDWIRWDKTVTKGPPAPFGYQDDWTGDQNSKGCWGFITTGSTNEMSGFSATASPTGFLGSLTYYQVVPLIFAVM